MTIFSAFILALVQGLTEFIPVSSSGHLVLVPYLFNWPEQTLLFDTTLHLGTGLALVIYFWKDLLTIIQAVPHDYFHYKFRVTQWQPHSRLLLYMIIGTIPAAFIGFLFSDYFEYVFRAPSYVILFLFLGTVLMSFAEYYLNKKKFTNSMPTFFSSLIIGFFQSFALFPGLSRSGSTISGGIFVGLSRESAARFSFMLSIPVVLMAGLLQLFKGYSDISSALGLPLLVGFVTSFVSGLVALRWLLNFVKTHSLLPFIVYRTLLCLFLLIIIVL